jgi:UDP-N-acetylmuramoyl-L-alanyl-D-glutamate--2,6-diaminopimelate ligase
MAGLPVTLRSGSEGTAIHSIVEDSRAASPGCLFIARCGTRDDGRRYLAEAITAGAAAVLVSAVDGPADPAGDRLASENREIRAGGVALLGAADVAAAGAMLAERFHGDPSAALTLIGVTGTNGKTTTAHLVQQLLQRCGTRCGLIGTVLVDDGRTCAAASLTTPPAVELSAILARMVRHGCRACVMEASSHALEQRRTDGLRFRIGIFTNLTGDHMDYHGTMERYADAKARLFERLPPDGAAVINSDDPAADRMRRTCRAAVLTCSLHGPSAACQARVVRESNAGTRAVFRGPWGEFEVDLPLIGRHNVMNALQAAAACAQLGVPADALRDGLAHSAAPPGRLERVAVPDGLFTVLVDYAHTDDALENVLRALRDNVPERGRLRIVFGCGGDRDRTKRPRMAAAACRWADEVIITSDNPRTEDPRAIIDEILRGVPPDANSRVTVEVDRGTAIALAVERARESDVILIAGKGHENDQIIGTTKRPFDDRLVAAAAIRAHVRRAATA